MTEQALEIKRMLRCSEAEAVEKDPGPAGRIDRGCYDSETAAAFLGAIAGEDASGLPPDEAVLLIKPEKRMVE